MADSITQVIDKVQAGVGQGSVLDQVDKRYRKQQRLTLFAMLDEVDEGKVALPPVTLYRHIP